MRSGCLVGAVRPLSSWTSHTYTTTLPPYILIVPQSAPHFLVISLPPTATLGHQGAAFQHGKIRRCWTPQADRWRILPNHQGFASNSPHSSPCQQLSCSSKPTIFSRPPHQAPTCPTAFPILASSATLFAFLPSNILSQTKTPCFPISGAPCQRPNMVGCNI